MRAEPERCPVLGVAVSPVDLAAAVSRIESWVRDGAAEYVCVTGVHGVMECLRDESLTRVHNRAGMVVPDGMPLVWLARRRGFPEAARVYGPDLMLAMCDRGRRVEMRHFFYGGGEGVPERLADRLGTRYPGLRVVGCHAPPFRPLFDREAVEVARRINDARPDVVWVGLSTPKQERWMARFRPALQAPVLIGVGAAFDFHAGRKRQAPRWMRARGLEWAFRLLMEPRRLGPRYLRNNPAFLARVLAEELRLRWGASALTRNEVGSGPHSMAAFAAASDRASHTFNAAGRAVPDGSSDS